MNHPWEGKPWAPWFANFKDETGNVDPPPFGQLSFYPNPTMIQWGQVVGVNPRGHGIGPGSCWASRECADFVAFTLKGEVVDGRPTFQGGVAYLQPQFLVRITREDGAYLDINPGEIADRFAGPAGPTGLHSAEFIDWWLTRLTAFTPGNFVPAP